MFPVSVSKGVQRRMNMVWLFFIIAVAAGFPCLDGAALPGLTCTVTKMNDGCVMYQISGKPSSIKHNSSWEENNGIVIVAINSRYNESVVKTVKNDSVELYVCEDFLRYNMHFKKDGRHSKLTATCEANCTHLMTKDPPQVDDGFSIGRIVGIVIGIIIFLALIVIVGLIFRFGIKRILNQIRCGFTFHNPRSQTNRLQSPQSETQSEADAIMDNLKNEQVSTDASPFLPERADPEDPEDVKPTPLSACNREPRSA
ncbi:uncharacterized protein LOC112141403 isoform X2 [Oryzias melastigma]|uniref:uncharacterized protein LOC112141403 isoform X2 n=1 Tax=Oryzias melastigma TaxID=30732 RepID=UPI000CF83903|nr:uncharacterized protein LOC112141403 isoform X2 [Oryzias melastigma]